MSGSSGGRADKLGNRYEGLWVAYQLLRLLAEEVSAVQLEAIGDDERGVDVWVTGRDGTRDAQQCKRKNRTLGRWGIGELDDKDVLKNLAAQLGRDASARFTFVSAHPAPELRELCDTARAAGGDPEAYFKGTLGVKAHAGNLRKFCQAVGASEHDQAGRQRAFDLLCRAYTHLFEDSPEGRGAVTVLARLLIAGNPETAIEVLANYAQDNMGSVIAVEQVRSHLRGRGLPPAHIAGNPQAAEQMERLREEFRESLRPSLIHSALVPRPEAAAVLDLITSQAERLVVLHARGGAGKSCVLLQLTELLERQGVPYLPLRLDRRTPQTSSLKYGTDVCGLPESPAVVLHALNLSRPAVLIVDQLDAVRWTAAHASAPWEACREVIDDALGLPGVAVVVACRTFDLRDDQQIHAWHAARKGKEVAVGDLPEEAVEAAVTAAGGKYASLTARQRKLLRSPLHLALWTQVVGAGETPGGWATHADLLRAFWRSRLDAAARMGVPAAETREAVDALVGEMDRRGELAAPARTLDRWPRAAAALKSLHVVVEVGRRLTFAHQTYFEYQLATRLLDDAQGGGRSVLDWVRDGEQSLLRREQLRLVLTLLRDEEPAEYARTVRGLVLAPPGEVRFHLRQLALRALGESPAPTAIEGDLACELAETPGWRDHVLDQVFTRQPAWLEAADDRGLIARWLASGDEPLIQAALLACRFWSDRCGDRVARLLAPHLDRPDPWPRRVAEALPFNPADDSEPLFRLRLRLIRGGAFRHRHLTAKELAERHPERLIDLLEAHLDRRHAVPGEGNDADDGERDSPHQVHLHEAEHLDAVADALARPFWERLAPLVVRSCEATREEGRRPSPFFEDRTWPADRWRFAHSGTVELLRFVAHAGSRLAAADPARFEGEYAAWLNHPGLSVQRMVGLALADAGVATADLAVGWLCDNPARFSLPDESGRRWGIARRILARHGVACSVATYDRLEQAILGYHAAEERRSVEYHLHEVRSGWIDRPNRWGLTQHALLPSLPAGRLGVRARSEMGVLAEKFGCPADEFDPGPVVRMVTLAAPIPAERAAGISDHAWLQIIGGAARSARRRRRASGGHSRVDDTAEGYSQQLGLRARWEPGRFAALALSIPADANPAYLEAILREAGHTSPPNPDAVDWVPASDQQIAAVIEHVGYRADGRLGYNMCWLMRQRPQALSTPLCREFLRCYATDHPEPTPGWSVTANEAPDHEATAINCTRGSALGGIAQLLFASPELLVEFVPTLRRAAADEHPAVRVAAVEAFLPVLNADRNLAVELFLAACEGSDEILGTRRVGEFIRYSLRTHHRQLEPLLRRMAGSPSPAVATEGAGWLTFLSLGDRVTPESVTGYTHGTAAQRKGVATAAAYNCDDAETCVRCGELLGPLLDDPDEGVREKAGEFLREPDVLRSATGRRLAAVFAGGQEFPRHPFWLIEAIRKHQDSLVPLAPVFDAVCGRLAADLADPARRGDHRAWVDLERFFPLILRLYEQAEQGRDVPLRNRCLDWWDRLLEARMGGAAQALGELDAGVA